jgi:hypothetical protein
MLLLCLIIFVVSEKKAFEYFPIGSNVNLCPAVAAILDAFFSETTNMIKAKLYMNVHWMVLYNLNVFCSDMKFKMAATAGLSLTLDPMGKMFQNGGGHLGFSIGIKNKIFVEDIPMIIPGQFGFNCPSGFREKAF